ncbi:MAG: Asp-tRNA(Asn)/Glu-tRNA(Gln) amidotransferase subunit GatC [Magnetococcus sp. DMHC-6]
MPIQVQNVEHVAKLARLEITPEEIHLYTEQLAKILELMDQLNQLPTDSILPMAHALDVELPLRTDTVTHTNQRDLLLTGAPDPESGHFRVPKIIQ